MTREEFRAALDQADDQPSLVIAAVLALAESAQEEARGKASSGRRDVGEPRYDLVAMAWDDAIVALHAARGAVEVAEVGG